MISGVVYPHEADPSILLGALAVGMLIMLIIVLAYGWGKIVVMNNRAIKKTQDAQWMALELSLIRKWPLDWVWEWASYVSSTSSTNQTPEDVIIMAYNQHQRSAHLD